MTMGTSTQMENTDTFTNTKTRIDRAFEKLREEMKEIQRQDIDLLTQLMHIRHTILLLSQSGDRRSYSIDALDHRSDDVTRPDMTSASARRRALTRVQSAPIESPVVEEVILEEEEEYDDDLTQSLDSAVLERRFADVRHSVVSNASSRTTNDRNSYADSDFIYALGPLPPVFKRLMTSSSPGGPSPRSSACAEEVTSEKSLQTPSSSHSGVNGATNSSVTQEKSVVQVGIKRRKLQRQKSVEEQYENTGKTVIDCLRRTQSMSSTPYGIQV